MGYGHGLAFGFFYILINLDYFCPGLFILSIYILKHMEKRRYEDWNFIFEILRFRYMRLLIFKTSTIFTLESSYPIPFKFNKLKLNKIKIQMSYEIKTTRIQTLEPNKLSESIKSKNGAQQKQRKNIVQQHITYQAYYTAHTNSNTNGGNGHGNGSGKFGINMNGNSNTQSNLNMNTNFNKEDSTQMYQQQSYNKRVTATQEIYGASDMGGSDRNFKKNNSSSNQIQLSKLNQLKKEYEILRNIKIDDSFIYEQKIPGNNNNNNNNKKAESSVEPSENNSVRSGRTNSKNHKNVGGLGADRNANINGIAQYEKKQLEFMLANSMSKVEELLKAEVQYKRKIYQLTRLNPQTPTQKYEQKLKNALHTEKSNQQTIDRLKSEQQKLRNLNFHLTERIRYLQSENFNHETENRRMGDEKKRLQQILLLEKENIMNIKIQVKKVELERDMMQKEKNLEAERYKRTVKDLNTENQRLSAKIKKQQQEISDLNDKLRQLSQQLSNEISKSSHKKPQKTPQKQKQKQSQNASSDNFQKKLAQKIKQLQKAQQQQVRKQINHLKEQMDNLRERHEDINESQQVHLEIRIAALEKIINEDNEEKMSFLEELRRIIKDFQDLELQNQQLKQKLRKATKQLSQIHQTTSFQLDRLQKSQTLAKATYNLQQVNNYLTKIRKLEAENKQLRSRIIRLEDSMSGEESRTEERVREYERKVEDAEIEIEKLVKQNQFNLEISAAKYKSEVELAKNDAVRASKQRNQERLRFEQARKTLQSQLQTLRQQKQQVQQTLTTKLSQKDTQLSTLRTSLQTTHSKLRQDHQTQLFTLLGRLDQLIKSNQLYVMENTRLLNCEAQLYELRQRCKKMVGLSEGVDHLWQVKEAEYYNVNLLLKEIKD